MSEGSLPCALLTHWRTALSSHLGVCSLLMRKFVTLVQNHELTLSILPKIILAGLQVLHSSANVAELSWACGQVVHHVLGFR